MPVFFLNCNSIFEINTVSKKLKLHFKNVKKRRSFVLLMQIEFKTVRKSFSISLNYTKDSIIFNE